MDCFMATDWAGDDIQEEKIALWDSGSRRHSNPVQMSLSWAEIADLPGDGHGWIFFQEILFSLERFLSFYETLHQKNTLFS